MIWHDGTTYSFDEKGFEVSMALVTKNDTMKMVRLHFCMIYDLLSASIDTIPGKNTRYNE